jgi:prefoldin subunit 5
VNFRQQEVELLKQQVQAYENIIEHFKRELLVVQGKLSNYPPHREA